MIEDLPDVPPAVLLLVAEAAQSKDWTSARKRIKAILKDLRDQSEAYQASGLARQTANSKPLEFDIHLHGGLNLFDRRGACMDLHCRLHTADKLARSMGLIADRIWITDYLTEKFIDFGRATNEKLDAIVADVMVLVRLWPLIAAGILRFRSPWVMSCEGCLSHFENSIRLASREVATKFANEIKITTSPDGGYTAETGNCFEPPLWLHSLEGATKHPTSQHLAEEIIYEQVRSALWVGREAAMFGGSIFSNSRVGLAGLLQQEGRFGSKKQLTLLDDERAIQVPWVSELDAAQIIELRQEASLALPLFREKMAKALSINESSEPNATTSAEFVQELREQAAEVRSELEATKKNSARFWKTSYGLLGLGLSAYGVATDQILPGVGGLLPLINLLINHTTGHEKEITKLTYRPSYVLVKAQDILGHAH